MHNLGAMLENGRGISKNLAEAKIWYERAAALEYAPALNDLGRFYLAGAGVPKSYVRAKTVNAVIGATPGEIQRVARIVAKLKGRYLATLMDLGNAHKGPIGDSEVRELRRAREMYEEVELGLTRLREAIEAGDLELDGVKTD